MRRQQQRANARSQGIGLARSIDIPLPTKGTFIEAKSAEVSGLYAGELVNWRSTGASLELRSPYSIDATGDLSSQRIAFEFGSAQHLINVIGAGLFSETASFVRSMSVPLATAYMSSNAVMVDGSGPPILYDGTAFTDGTFTTSTAKSQNDFNGITAHQDRLYFWEEGDDLDFYYADTVGAITGNLTRFPLGRLGNITGKIVTALSMTMDAGEDINDVFTIFTSTGWVVVYRGTNPGDAANWNQITRMKVSPPVDPRAFVAVGSDLWFLTASGVVSAKQTVANSSLALVNTISRNVQKKLIAQIAEGGEWSMHLSADSTSVIVNRVYNDESTQFVLSTETKSWLETDYPATEWVNLGLKTHFTDFGGHLGTLGETDGHEIAAKWTSSWFRLPRSTGITYLKPTILAKGSLTVKVTLLSDHDDTGTDLSEAEQIITIEPDDPADPGGRVAINEEIAVDAVGEAFQIIMEIFATEAEFVNLKAGVL